MGRTGRIFQVTSPNITAINDKIPTEMAAKTFLRPYKGN
jgi:hypothetical protein